MTRVHSASMQARQAVRRDAGSFGPYVLAIAHALEARGLDAAEVFRRAGLERLPDADPLMRINAATVRRIYAEARALTGDDFLGLWVAQQMQSTHLHAIGPGLLASTSLRDFLDRLVRYFPLIASAVTVGWNRSGDEVIVSGTESAPDSPWESDDVFCGYVVRLMREITSGRFVPAKILLRRPLPADGGATHHAYFHCPVEFGRDRFAIVLSAESLDQPLPGGNRELADYADALAMRYLAQLDRSDVESRVRLILLQELGSRPLTKALVARQLHMSPSTLQQKLAARGTTFNALLDDVRRVLAERYLADASRPITEIAYLLGFAGSSSFCRAYRRWTGHAPGRRRPHAATGAEADQ